VTNLARRQAERRGRHAELLAALFLATKGYRPLAWRYKTPLGEIDLIVKRGDTIVFVEVKARASAADLAHAFDPAAMRRIAAAADIWLSRHPRGHTFNQRFDLLLLAPGKLPRHIENVFQIAPW